MEPPAFAQQSMFISEVTVKVAKAMKLFQGINILISNKCERSSFLAELVNFLTRGGTASWQELGQVGPPKLCHSANWCDSKDHENHRKTSKGCPRVASPHHGPASFSTPNHTHMRVEPPLCSGSGVLTVPHSGSQVAYLYHIPVLL